MVPSEQSPGPSSGERAAAEHGTAPTVAYLDVLPTLAAACASYDGPPTGADGEDDGEFIAIGNFVVHLIELLDGDDTACFEAVFAVVERVLAEGDDEARSLLTEGFFDDLTNPELYGDTARHPRDFVPWLGARARQVPAVQPLL